MSFKLARSNSQSIPRTVTKAVATGQAFNEGALLVVDGSDNFTECGATPTAVGAVALTGYGSDITVGSHFGRVEFPAGFMKGMSILDDVQWRALYVGNLPAANGGIYGVIRDTDSNWKVNFADIDNGVVKLVGRLTDSPENGSEVIVTFLRAVAQVI